MKRYLPLILLALVLAVALAFLLLVDEAESPPAGAGVEPGGPLPGPEWTGKGRSGISQAEAEAFGEFSLFWLGPSFAGYNLQAILHVEYDAPPQSPKESGNEVTFIYGSCRPRPGPEPSCPTPLAVIVQPVCQISVETATEVAYEGPPQALRGGALVVTRTRDSFGMAMVWTGSTLIDVQTPRLGERLDEILQSLRGLGRNAVAPGEPLPPPDFSAC